MSVYQLRKLSLKKQRPFPTCGERAVSMHPMVFGQTDTGSHPAACCKATALLCCRTTSYETCHGFKTPDTSHLPAKNAAAEYSNDIYDNLSPKGTGPGTQLGPGQTLIVPLTDIFVKAVFPKPAHIALQICQYLFVSDYRIIIVSPLFHLRSNGAVYAPDAVSITLRNVHVNRKNPLTFPLCKSMLILYSCIYNNCIRNIVCRLIIRPYAYGLR